MRSVQEQKTKREIGMHLKDHGKTALQEEINKISNKNVRTAGFK